jgi:hypothetical protein
VNLFDDGELPEAIPFPSLDIHPTLSWHSSIIGCFNLRESAEENLSDPFREIIGTVSIFQNERMELREKYRI